LGPAADRKLDHADLEQLGESEVARFVRPDQQQEHAASPTT